MKLVIINGSPRGKNSNSKVITNWMISGFENIKQSTEFFVSKIKTHTQAVQSIEDNDSVLIAFPLYTDSMPGILKLFFEELESIKDARKGVKIYFVIQSGFQGANHCRNVEKYLEFLAKHMGFSYMGSAVKPSGEGLRLMPASWTRKIRKSFESLGKDIDLGRGFNEAALKKLAKFEKPSTSLKWIINRGFGTNMYFNSLLKKNNAYDKRFDKPYVK